MEILSNILFFAVLAMVSFALTVISRVDKNNSSNKT